MDDEPSAKLVADIMQYQERFSVGAQANLVAAEKRVAKIEAEASNLVQALKDGRGSTFIMDQLELLEKELRIAQTQLLEVQKKTGPRFDQHQVNAYLKVVAEELRERKDENRLKALAQRFVETVTVSENQVAVKYKFDDIFPGSVVWLPMVAPTGLEPVFLP